MRVTREIGFQTNGLWGWGHIEADVAESNPELQWPHSTEVYDKMRREEAQIASVLRAVMLPIRSANWHIEPGAARPEVVEFVSRALCARGGVFRGRNMFDSRCLNLCLGTRFSSRCMRFAMMGWLICRSWPIGHLERSRS